MTRLWHGALAALVLLALVGQTVAVLRSAGSFVDLFSYFTIQSNVLVLVAATLIVVRPERDGAAWRALRLAGLVGITVTGVVYAVAIGPYVSFEGAAWWYDTIFHYVSPVMAVLGYVASRSRTRFRTRDLAVIAWPVAWLVFTLLRAALGSPRFLAVGGGTSRYPYDFLDVDAHGVAHVVTAAVLVTLLMLGVACGYLLLGGRRPRS